MKLITQTNNASIFAQMNHEPDPSTGPWEVQIKDARKSRQGFEITVIRQNNIHGHRSWGWIDDNKLLISSSGVPTMPRVFSSSRQSGTPHCMKNESEAASIQREKLGKKTMPAGSQSPKATWTVKVVVRGMRSVDLSASQCALRRGRITPASDAAAGA